MAKFTGREFEMANERPRRWRELYEMRVILARTKPPDARFIYHVQAYQRKRWVEGSLNIATKRELLKLIKDWLKEAEDEITNKDWEL